MKINLRRELKFIHSEKVKMDNKDSLIFELLNIAHVVISNYVNVNIRNLKSFYEIIYFKAKNFYLDQYNR